MWIRKMQYRELRFTIGWEQLLKAFVEMILNMTMGTSGLCISAEDGSNCLDRKLAGI
jgi:hypothetical protein